MGRKNKKHKVEDLQPSIAEAARMNNAKTVIGTVLLVPGSWWQNQDHDEKDYEMFVVNVDRHYISKGKHSDGKPHWIAIASEDPANEDAENFNFSRSDYIRYTRRYKEVKAVEARKEKARRHTESLKRKYADGGASDDDSAADDVDADIHVVRPGRKRESPSYQFFSTVGLPEGESATTQSGYPRELRCCNLCDQSDPKAQRRMHIWASGDAKSKGNITSTNLVAHLRKWHPALWEKISLASPQGSLVQDELTGETVYRRSFKDDFPHKVRYVMTSCEENVGSYRASKKAFREYIKGMTSPTHTQTHTHTQLTPTHTTGLDSQTTLPSRNTFDNIVEAIKATMQEITTLEIGKTRERLGEQFVGLQQDCWSSYHSKFAFSGLSCSFFKEVQAMDGLGEWSFWTPINIGLELEEFGAGSHTGEAIADSIKDTLDKLHFLPTDTGSFDADGAANVQKAGRLLVEKGIISQKAAVSVCIPHEMGRAIKVATGTASDAEGSTFDHNDGMKELIKKANALSSTFHRSTKLSKELRNICEERKIKKRVGVPDNNKIRWGSEAFLWQQLNMGMSPIKLAVQRL